ncbi:MAG: transcriptional regulator, GntR family [Microbacteriaceae bacterium]|jgi:GntR family transcriptional repressor for pyruvate dehydrogenase complex|nr:transcriptional regulator, GntR family [Microbacteriaceae bacterium]
MDISQVPPLRRRVRGVSVELAAHFERLIATGALRPGSKLPPERELALSMSVSRASLREAMHELESKHLIDRAPGRGTTVSEPRTEVGELVALRTQGGEQEAHAGELRLVIEPRIAGFAAARATAANILLLEDSLSAQSENLNPAESLRLDLEFHVLLAQAAQNPLLSAVITLTSQWTSDVRQHSHATKEGRRISVRGHRAILDAVRAQDERGARTAMEAHLSEVQGLITKGRDRGASA